MAIYSLSASVISRGKGHSATAAAAYRARTMILDERTGQTHDYSRMKNEAVFTGIYAPKDAPAWAHDRQQLWNKVEQSEKRKDAQMARDFMIALPHELTPEQNRWLVQDWVRENVTRQQYAADVAIHAPSEHGDTRNIHAHILVTMRTLDAEGFAATKDRSMNSKEQLQAWRQSWETLANRHLERHGHQERIDRRTLKAQGLEREPGLHMGKAASAAARKGHTTERGERQEQITTRNRSAEALLRELAALQQHGIAAQFKENAMAWYDRAFDTLTTIAAYPLGFLMGDVQEFQTPTGNEQATDITIRTDEVTIHQEAQAEAAQTAETGHEAAPAVQEAAPQELTALDAQRLQQQQLDERLAWEKAYYEAQELRDEQYRECGRV